jgi:hypothetical protein
LNTAAYEGIFCQNFSISSHWLGPCSCLYPFSSTQMTTLHFSWLYSLFLNLHTSILKLEEYIMAYLTIVRQRPRRKWLYNIRYWVTASRKAKVGTINRGRVPFVQSVNRFYKQGS